MTFGRAVEMFGQARFSLTKRLTKEAVIVENAHNVDIIYQFRLRTRKRQGRENWSCMDCESMKKRTGCLQSILCIELDGTRHSSDPQNPTYAHFCHGKSKDVFTARQVPLPTAPVINHARVDQMI